ncbi:MAG: S8 family serine peptidase [Spirochaetia bacterium]|nr:S8 family serine peptidase [Spirochaetia bacterium]
MSKFYILLSLLILVSCSSYSKIPAPYKETFSKDINSIRIDKNEIDPRVAYSPGVVSPTPVTRIYKDTETGSLIARDEFVVLLREGKNPEALLSELKAARINASLTGFVPTFRLVQLLSLDASTPQEALLERIRLLPSVEKAHPHFVRQEQEARVPSNDWHIRRYGIQEVWKKDNGAGVLVAILDSGMDTSLAAWGNRITHPYSVLNRSETFEDGEVKRGGDVLRVIDHGTRVASIAGAAETNSILTGVAPGIRIMPIQVIGFHRINETIYTNDLTILEGLARAMALKAAIINVSLGTDYARVLRDSVSLGAREEIVRRIQKESTTVREIYDGPFEMAKRLNVWIVVAAGNSANSAEYEPIASHKYVISVGALDSEDRRAGFSNFGGSVATYAPGVGVPTLLPGGTLAASSGTSFSAPYVTGMLALLRANNPWMRFEQARALVAKSNITSRTTILPTENTIPVFDPVGLLASVGIAVPRDTHFLHRTFHERYSDLFIDKADSDAVKLEKILAYYSRSFLYFARDPEAMAALPLIPSNFSVIRSRAESSITFNEIKLIADSALSPEQIAYFRANLSRNDYFAIIVNFKKDRNAVPGLLARLKVKQFNANTLAALGNFNEPGTHGQIIEYMKRLHSQPGWVADESFAMLAIVATANLNVLDDQDRALLAACVPRYRKAFFEAAENNLVEQDADFVVEALIRAGNRDGILLALDAVDQIERSLARLKVSSGDPVILEYYRNSREQLGVRLESLQKQINEATAFPIRYNHQAPHLERERTRAQFIEYMKTARLRDGKFYER